MVTTARCFILCSALLFTSITTASGQQTDTAKPDSSVQQASAKPADVRPNPDATGIYRIGGSVLAPKVLHSVEPKIAKKDLKHAKSGTTLVQITVDAEGQVQNAHVIKSSLETMKSKDNEAAAIIDQSALDAVKQYGFAPAKLDGKPVPVLINIEVKFRIF